MTVSAISRKRDTPSRKPALQRLLPVAGAGRTHADCQQAVLHPCSPSLVAGYAEVTAKERCFAKFPVLGS
jgi:hypothetical protein